MKIRSIARFLVVFTALNLFAAIAWGGEAQTGQSTAIACPGEAGKDEKVVAPADEHKGEVLKDGKWVKKAE